MSDELRRHVLDAVARGELPSGGPSEVAARDLLDDAPGIYWERWASDAARRIRVRPPEPGVNEDEPPPPGMAEQVDPASEQPAMTLSQRDPDRERRFLLAASPLAPPFRDHALERLATGEKEYGSSWATRGITDLLSEIAEECADVGAWASLTEQALDQRDDLEPAQREAIATALLDATKFASLAYARILNTRRRLLAVEGEQCHGC